MPKTGAGLDRALALINAGDLGALRDALELLLDFPSTRLAAYGTLQPGESNYAMLADVPGTWRTGTVQGVRFTARGYPAFRPGTGDVSVSVLNSAALPEHWARLDEFEGQDYRRILVPVRLADGGILVANLYAYIAP